MKKLPFQKFLLQSGSRAMTSSLRSCTLTDRKITRLAATSWRWFLSFSVFLFVQESVYGKDFGHRGEVFVIEEENLITVLQRKMAQDSSNIVTGSAFQAIIEAAKHPRSPNIPLEAKKYRIYYYDPTFITQESITDKNGAILFPKGTKINPLTHTKLSTGLLFLNGDDPAHLNWARSQERSFKWILVQGNPFELEEQEQRPVYFDQKGFSVSKFKIQQIPARVTQEDLHLKIEEIPLQELESPS